MKIDGTLVDSMNDCDTTSYKTDCDQNLSVQM